MADDDLAALLGDASRGKKEVLDRIFSAVETEIHRIAGRFMREERPDHPLQATALVHEVYVRLVNQKTVNFEDRAHFLRLISRKMRHILIDWARKRTDPDKRQQLSGIIGPFHDRHVEAAQLAKALEQLEESNQELADLASWRLLCGMSTSDLARKTGQGERKIRAAVVTRVERHTVRKGSSRAPGRRVA
jgi:RNA polymerase sigma factor (TIGR02999 family)